MNVSLQFISISHKTATVVQRGGYHISEEEKPPLAHLIRDTFLDIKGLFLLSTCNRTEIYFESSKISATTIRDFFIKHKVNNASKASKKLFDYSNNTEDTIRHLLQVSSGLESLVLGDAEIIHQIKKAYQFSMVHQLQGSLLERALQTVFKSHKRTSNETNFRDGTTSVAYKSLKVLRDTYGKSLARPKKILFVGAGDIVKQLFLYNAKFNFNNIYISNRSEDKAIVLANKYNCKTYAWDKVLANDFRGFDIIVSAVSNCFRIINKIPEVTQKTLLIDLAIPSNIDKRLANNTNVICYDLDTISSELEDTKEKRFAAMDKVNNIINEELSIYKEWLKDAPLRQFLAEYKIVVKDKVKDYFKETSEDYNSQKIKTVTNQVMRKLMAETETLKSISKIDTLISEQVSL
jgi:glutamyl-tRNA reductase